jgi:arylsulfatase A-like enzyme
VNRALKAVLFLALAAVARAADRPNIVLIMADDMGYSDIGCYGGEIHSPNLDQLAAGGVRFTQFYNTARCCSTRASLLTGLYPHQAGVGHMTEDRGLEGYQGDLNRRCVTIAEVLHGSGYRTYMTGKWHVTKTEFDKARSGQNRQNWPRQRGFDRFFGTISGGGSYFDPATLTLDNTLIAPGDSFYYTDAIGEHAAQFIKESESGKPFFLYVAFTAPHWPLHAKPQDIAKYSGRYDKGWDVLREERHERQLQMGLLERRWPISPRAGGAPAWADVKNKDWFARRMEVYAAQVDCLDQNVGRIVAALKDARQLDQTLILFLSDNGGCAEEIGSQGPPRNVSEGPLPKPLGKDGLQFALKPSATRDGRPMREGRSVIPGGDDTYLSYGLPWANASNTPFRFFKHFVHEGGISTPLIAHWPAGIQRRGVFEQQPGHLVDIMATCVDAAGAAYPADFHGEKIQPMEGRSLLPAFAGEPVHRDVPLFWEHEGNRALRSGAWKLVAKGPAGKWELYDMENDRTELNNLAGEQPKKVEELAALWEAYAQRTHAIPWPWKPAYSGPAGKE